MDARWLPSSSMTHLIDVRLSSIMTRFAEVHRFGVEGYAELRTILGLQTERHRSRKNRSGSPTVFTAAMLEMVVTKLDILQNQITEKGLELSV